MYIDVNLIIFEHKLSPQPIPFRLLGRPTRGKGARPSGPVSLASPLFGTEMPEPDARAPDRDSVSPEGVVGKLNRAYSAVSSPCVSRKIFKRHTSELKKPTVSSPCVRKKSAVPRLLYISGATGNSPSFV
jgi:hypothetical protein